MFDLSDVKKSRFYREMAEEAIQERNCEVAKNLLRKKMTLMPVVILERERLATGIFVLKPVFSTSPN